MGRARLLDRLSAEVTRVSPKHRQMVKVFISVTVERSPGCANSLRVPKRHYIRPYTESQRGSDMSDPR